MFHINAGTNETQFTELGATQRAAIALKHYLLTEKPKSNIYTTSCNMRVQARAQRLPPKVVVQVPQAAHSRLPGHIAPVVADDAAVVPVQTDGRRQLDAAFRPPIQNV